MQIHTKLVFIFHFSHFYYLPFWFRMAAFANKSAIRACLGFFEPSGFLSVILILINRKLEQDWCDKHSIVLRFVFQSNFPYWFANNKYFLSISFFHHLQFEIPIFLQFSINQQWSNVCRILTQKIGAINSLNCAINSLNKPNRSPYRLNYT